MYLVYLLADCVEGATSEMWLALSDQFPSPVIEFNNQS